MYLLNIQLFFRAVTVFYNAKILHAFPLYAVGYEVPQPSFSDACSLRV